MIINIESS